MKETLSTQRNKLYHQDRKKEITSSIHKERINIINTAKKTISPIQKERKNIDNTERTKEYWQYRKKERLLIQ